MGKVKTKKQVAKKVYKNKSKAKLGPLQKKWIAALRSGKYEQTRYALKNDTGYCCLGVACEVAGMKPRRVGKSGAFVFGKDFSASLPSSVRKKLMCRTENGFFTGKPAIDGRDNLASLNDSGKYSFSKIADFIERRHADIFTGAA